MLNVLFDNLARSKIEILVADVYSDQAEAD
jgi:hypothetical protein